MCVRVYVCEQLVLPESLLNYLKHAFRILNIMMLSLFDIFWYFPPKLNEYLSNMIVDVLLLDCFKGNFFRIAQIPVDGTNYCFVLVAVLQLVF